MTSDAIIIFGALVNELTQQALPDSCNQDVSGVSSAALGTRGGGSEGRCPTPVFKSGVEKEL